MWPKGHVCLNMKGTENMTEKQAIEIIDKVRIGNSFTMGLSTEEFIQDLRKRYLQMYNIVLPANYVEIAKELQRQEENNVEN